MSDTGDMRRSSSGWLSPWRLVGFSLLVLCALLSAMPLDAQNSNGSEPPSLLQLLTQAEQSLTLLSDRLAERKQQVTDLRENLRQASLRVVALELNLIASVEYSETLEQDLQAAKDSQSSLQTALMETSRSLTLQETQYAALSTSWTRYREYAQSEYARLTLARNLWAVGCAGAVLAALAALVWAVVK